MEAPEQISLAENEIIDYKSFEKDNYKIEIGKSKNNQQIIIKLTYQNGIVLMKKFFSYDEVIKKIKPLRINENIDELYSNLIELFKNNQYILKYIENE